MDLFDILSNDERIIVASDPSERAIITWNQSSTFQYFKMMKRDVWEEIAIRTTSLMPHGYFQARVEAMRWLRDGVVSDR